MGKLGGGGGWFWLTAALGASHCLGALVLLVDRMELTDSPGPLLLPALLLSLWGSLSVALFGRWHREAGLALGCVAAVELSFVLALYAPVLLSNTAARAALLADVLLMASAALTLGLRPRPAR